MAARASAAAVADDASHGQAIAADLAPRVVGRASIAVSQDLNQQLERRRRAAVVTREVGHPVL